MAGGWEQWGEQWGYFLASSGGALGRVCSSSVASARTGWLWFLAVANWMPCCLLVDLCFPDQTLTLARSRPCIPHLGILSTSKQMLHPWGAPGSSLPHKHPTPIPAFVVSSQYFMLSVPLSFPGPSKVCPSRPLSNA